MLYQIVGAVRSWGPNIVSRATALFSHCTAALLQLIQIDVQPAEEVIVRLTGEALDDRALQAHLLLFDAQLDFLDTTIGEDNLVNSRHTRLQTLFANGYG